MKPDLVEALAAGQRGAWQWAVYPPPLDARCVTVTAARPGAALCEEMADLQEALRWVARLLPLQPHQMASKQSAASTAANTKQLTRTHRQGTSTPTSATTTAEPNVTGQYSAPASASSTGRGMETIMERQPATLHQVQPGGVCKHADESFSLMFACNQAAGPDLAQ